MTFLSRTPMPRFAAIVILSFCVVVPGIVPALAYAALPAEMQLDVLSAELARAIEGQDHRKVLDVFRQMREQGIDLPARLAFVEALSLAELGQYLAARRSLERYMNEEGREGRYYGQAVALYVKIKDRAEAEEARELEANQRRIAEIQARAAAETKAQQICEDLRKSDGEEMARWKRVGQIARLNTEWKYAVINLDEGVTLTTERAADTGEFDDLFVFETQRIAFKAPPKITGAEASVMVGFGPFEMLKPGDAVYRKPGTRSSSYFSCNPQELFCQRIKQLCPDAGRIAGRIDR